MNPWAKTLPTDCLCRGDSRVRKT